MIAVRYGCSGLPGFVYEAGAKLCPNDAVVFLVRGPEQWKRRMCVECALAFVKRCQRQELREPLFELIPDAGELVT